LVIALPCAAPPLKSGTGSFRLLRRQHGRRRPRGRRHISWLRQVCTDLNLPASNAFNITLDPDPMASGFALHDDDSPE